MLAQVTLRCRCQAKFPVDRSEAGAQVECPRCGRALLVPESVASKAPPPLLGKKQPVQWVPDESTEEKPPQKKRRWLKPVLIALVCMLIPASLLVAFFLMGQLQHHNNVERVVLDYLEARRDGDPEAIQRLALLDGDERIDPIPDPHLVEQVGEVKKLKGSFKGVGKFHKTLKSYTRAAPHAPVYAKGIDMAKVAEARRRAKQAIHSGEAQRVINSATSMDLFPDDDRGWNDLMKWGKMQQDLVNPVEASIVDYSDLLEKTPVKLDEAQRELCLFYREHMEKFDSLFAADDFTQVRASDTFTLQTAEVTVWLGSPGDEKARKVRYRLIRFQLEGLDTGWKILEVVE